jgi:hypothetical protein
MFSIEIRAIDGTDYFVGLALVAGFEVLGGEWVEGERRWD